MKKSISYWAFEGGMEGTADIGKVFKQAHEIGYEAVELCIGESGVLGLKATEKQCGAIQELAAKHDVEIASVASGLYWSGNLSSAKVTDRNKAEQAAKAMLKITSWLGVDALLFIPGAVDVFFQPDAHGT